jgi:membrane protein
MHTIKFILRLINEAYYEWSHDRAARLGAALAYYALFSIAPLLIIVITIAGSVYGEAAARGQIVHAVSDEIGPDAARGLEQLLAGVYATGSDLFTTLLSTIILIYAATNLFSQLRDALNTMWHVRRKRRGHILGSLLEIALDRLISGVMIISLGILLLATLAISASLTALDGWVQTIVLPDSAILPAGGNLLQGFLFTTLLFALMFKLLPDVQIAWRVVWVGALVTAALFNLGAFLIGLYFGYGAQSALGAASSLIILMIWIAVSAQIIFFGAKFALVYATAIGRPILPASNAVRMKLAETGVDLPPE